MMRLPKDWRWVGPAELGSPGRPPIKAGPFGSALKKSEYVESGYKIYGQEQVIADDCTIGDYFIDEAKYETLKSCAVQAGDILVSLVGSFGQVTIVPSDATPGIINPRLIRLSFDPKLIYGRYFQHFFRSTHAQHQLESRAHGGTMGVLNASDLHELKVPLPPLPEQKRIAAILDKADAIRRKRQEAIHLTEELLRSAFLEMFGDPVTNPKRWEVRKLGQAIREAQYGTAEKANSKGVGLPVLRMNNITYGGAWDLSDLKWCEIAEGDAAKYTTARGDLLFNRTNSPELVGKTAVWESDDVYAIAGYLIRVRFNELAEPRYVSGVLNSRAGKKLLFEKAKASNNMSNFSASELKRLEVPLPPIELQQRFSNLTIAIRGCIPKQDEALRSAVHLFGSLSQRAFSGRL